MSDRDLSAEEWEALIGLLEGPQTAPDWLVAAVKRGSDEDPEIASLRARIAEAERERDAAVARVAALEADLVLARRYEAAEHRQVQKLLDAPHSEPGCVSWGCVRCHQRALDDRDARDVTRPSPRGQR